jgi:WASH complex subunit strumpellin
MKTLELLRKCVGISGLNGIDKLLSFIVVVNMRNLTRGLRGLDAPTLQTLQEISIKTKSLNNFIEGIDKIYADIRNKLKILVGSVTPYICQIGQIVLLRKMIALELNNAARINSNLLYNEISNLNNSLMVDVIHGRVDATKPEEESKMLGEVSKLLTYMGFSEPLKKIYLTPDLVPHLQIVSFVCLLQMIGSISLDDKMKKLVRKTKKDEIEPACFLTGIVCYLNQFHPNYKKMLLALSSQYIRSILNFQFASIKDNKVLGQILGDVFLLTVVLDELMKLMEIKHKNEFIPLDIFMQINTIK